MNNHNIERKTEILKVHINELKQQYSYEQLLFYLKNITSIIKDDVEGTEKYNSSKQYADFLENMKKTGIYNPLIDK